jgi:hypothetical protein
VSPICIASLFLSICSWLVSCWALRVAKRAETTADATAAELHEVARAIEATMEHDLCGCGRPEGHDGILTHACITGDGSGAAP